MILFFVVDVDVFRGTGNGWVAFHVFRNNSVVVIFFVGEARPLVDESII